MPLLMKPIDPSGHVARMLPFGFQFALEPFSGQAGALDLLSDFLPLLIEPGDCSLFSCFSGGRALAEFIDQRFNVICVALYSGCYIKFTIFVTPSKIVRALQKGRTTWRRTVTSGSARRNRLKAAALRTRS
jgi:hypothetical protein